VENKIKKAATKLQLSPTVTRILLDRNGWNLDEIRQKMRRKGDRKSLFVSSQLEDPKSRKQDDAESENSRSRRSTCLLCFDDFKFDKKASLSWTCGHSVACQMCLLDYIKSEMEESLVDEPIRCLRMECIGVMEDDAILKILSNDKAWRTKYKRRMINGCIESSPRIYRCPQSDCDRILKTKTENRHQARCLCTKFTFCAKCGSKWRSYHKCFQDEDVASPSSKPKKTLKKIKKISKPCPQCGVPIQKNGGCHHMTCSKCKFDFCWQCLKSWKPKCGRHHS